MQSFLIVGSSKEERIAKAHQLALEKSDGVDLITLEEPKSIAEARAVKEALSRKPYASPAISVILQEAANLTPEAQNALLKTLEEPPGNSQIIITAPRSAKFLPTLLSRCTTLDLGPVKLDLTATQLRSSYDLYQKGSLQAKFDSLTDNSFTTWGELARQMLLFSLGGEDLLKESSPNLLTVLSEPELKKLLSRLDQEKLRAWLIYFQKTEEMMTAHLNRKLAFENLMLAFPAPK